MTTPSEIDTTFDGRLASEYSEEYDYVKISLDEVQKNIFSTKYDASKIHFIKGKVEDTLPKNNIKKISFLRLDTDWYESTKVELEYLFPKLSVGGIIMIDDYAVFTGSKKATDEYFTKNNIKINLIRLHPYGARIGVKCEI